MMHLLFKLQKPCQKVFYYSERGCPNTSGMSDKMGWQYCLTWLSVAGDGCEYQIPHILIPETKMG